MLEEYTALVSTLLGLLFFWKLPSPAAETRRVSRGYPQPKLSLRHRHRVSNSELPIREILQCEEGP